MVLDTLSRYSDKIEAKKITVITHFDDDIYVESDNYLLSIIIENLISNAIKYNKHNGHITIKLSSASGHILLSIEDSGIGISDENMEKIFLPFYRLHSTEYPSIKGNGIGLSIVKRLCDILNIKIVVKSKLNNSTTFLLHFN
ncbi:sensor histidine kinase [Flavobacterium piscinae]|uniref:sensor histidine kinase n=1 Tax=Flavobacterium piscinae TaxID=2506424 RepID=UPI002AABCE5F|nr:ATP-binding protein [Flavobacterium piscinae]